MQVVSGKVLGVALLGAALLLPATGFVAAQSGHVNDADTAALRADVQKALKGGRFEGVHVDTQGSSLVLSGQVRLLADKVDAGKKAEKRTVGLTVRNEIQVASREGAGDRELFEKLAKKLTYSREGYGTTTFNNITLKVENGVVTLGGLVVTPTDKDVALGEVTNTEGVRDLVDHVQVAPVSPNDDRLRLAEANAIYGYSQLNKYALNPAKPIRILVVNGKVTLVGVVDNEGDRNVAGLRANGVAGVFSVQNNLQVQGTSRESIR